MNDVCYLSEVSKRFGPDLALDKVSLSLPQSGFIGILGASGSGKSTLLNILSLLDEEYEGSGVILRKDPKSLSEEKRCLLRLKKIGYVFQSFNLLPLDTVEENLLLPLSAVSNAPTYLQKRRVRSLLRFVGLEEKRKQVVNTLSGGEKQRIAIARALVNDPDLLLCDEPSAALDEANAQKVFSLFQRIARRKLVVVVSHDAPLLRSYAEIIYHLEDGKIVDKEELEHPLPPAKIAEERPLGEKESASFGFFPLLRHAFRQAKEKKWRSLLSEASIALGLLGVGLSFYVSSSIDDQLRTSFSSIVPESQIVMASKNSSTSPLSHVYASSLYQTESLCKAYPDDIEDYGTSFLWNFEEWFTDTNYFAAISGSKMEILEGFSVRSINDYQWIDRSSLSFYPYRPYAMEDEDIALGLPYAQMFRLCLMLGIPRDYESLGDYLREKPLPILLSASHVEWNFDDEELFSLVSVTQTKKPTIFHSNHRFAHHWFIDRMKFRSTLTQGNGNEQSVYEVPYVMPIDDGAEFVKKTRLDPSLNSLILERADESFLGSLMEKGDQPPDPRLYLFQGDKSGPTYSDFNKATETCPSLLGPEPLSPWGLYADPSSIMIGYSHHLFFAPEEETASLLADAYSHLPLSQKDLPLAMPESGRDAYLLQSGGALRFNYDCSNLSWGREPFNQEEVVLSSALYEAWGKPSEVSVAGEISGEEVGDYYDREFRFAKLKVVGVKQAKKEVVYVCPSWSVDFFFFSLGASPFYLVPTGAVFQLRDGASAKDALEKLKEAMPEFEFGSPSEEVSSTIEGTLSYVSDVLIAFSALSLVSSSLLFAIVIGITMAENAKEEKLLFALGANRKDIERSLFCHCFLTAGGALLSSSLGMAILEVAVAFYLTKSFHASFEFTFAPLPLLAMAFCAFLFSLAMMTWIKIRLKKKKIVR